MRRITPNLGTLVLAMTDAPLHAALAWLRKQHDVRYAEVRLVDEGSERLRVRDGRPEQVTVEASLGVGIRVLGAKTWGFACSADDHRGRPPRRCGSGGRHRARSAAVARAPVAFPEQAASRGVYETPLVVDPFTIPARDQARCARCAGAGAPCAATSA